MALFSRLGDWGAVWIALAVLLLLTPRTRRAGAALALSLAAEVLCCNLILKPLCARPRPCDVNSAVALAVPRPPGYSFPSGHTGAAFAAAVSLRLSGRGAWIPALVLACLIALSRLYLYVHYPSDVLAGALLGAAAGWLGSGAARLVAGERGRLSE